MSDRRPPEALLELALDAFRREVLPSLEGELRYTGLMISNAVAIARRQCLSPEGAECADARASGDELERRLSVDRPDAADAGLSTDPDSGPGRRTGGGAPDLSRRLVDTIRSGAADPGRSLHDPLLAYLLDRVRDELEISNPRYLERDR